MGLLALTALAGLLASNDDDALPLLAEGYEVSVFAREPHVRNPAAMAFDVRGRLFVGQGPQWRKPAPDSPGDSVVILLDDNGDGRCDRTKTFATGFNSVQGLAWRGRDLWVANAPDLTIVRDLDGDDVADEYVLVFTDLGNLEHSLHGLHWAPDGKLYMSKGNSKGLNRTDRYAPKPFRDLWGLPDPPGAVDLPPPRTFTRDTYTKSYHPPADDWGREGGILRCDDRGRNLEIVARGLRNPWDIAYDDAFNWIGTDQDQTEGDRIFHPFRSAHFGWGHPWSYHWTGKDHLPTTPISGPLFHGSGAGVTWDPRVRRFYIADWLQRKIYVFRPEWNGAHWSGDRLETIAHAGSGRTMPGSKGRVFDPTDIEIGPDGALWILSWGHGYGATMKNGKQTDAGRVFRLTRQNARAVTPPPPPSTIDGWIDDLTPERIPARRTAAQETLLARGDEARRALEQRLDGDKLTTGQETWIAWTLARFEGGDTRFHGLARDADSLNLRIQAIRILERRGGADVSLLNDPEPRIRFAAVQAARDSAAIADLLAKETDRLVHYAAWQALAHRAGIDGLKRLLTDTRPAVRRGALLGLLQAGALSPDEVKPHADEPVAARWLAKVVGAQATVAIDPPGGAFGGPVQVTIRSQIGNADLRYTLDGSVPTDSSPRYRKPFTVSRDILVRAVAQRNRVAVGPVASAHFTFGAPAGLRVGAKAYVDREYAFTEIPPTLSGLAYRQTANDDAGEGGLSFRLDAPATIWVAHDERIDRKPAWLKTFERTDLRMATDDARFRLFRKPFPSGDVSLGPNATDGTDSGKSNYVVVVEPARLRPRKTPTTRPQALAALPNGDVGRGRALFGVAGCVKCHRAEGRGNTFAPDLSDIGNRADAPILLESILAPSAAITEGYASLHVRTTDGTDHVGFLLQETGLGLKLVKADGSVAQLAKRDIDKRRRLQQSAMPANYAQLLGPGELADLVAFLRTLRPTGFTFTRKDRAVEIRRDGRPIGTFAHGDDQVKRPFLANLHAPGGIQVTRAYPAPQGEDHPTMHPGVWLGYSALGGKDFWRNKETAEPVSLEIHADGFTAVTKYPGACTETVRWTFVSRPKGTLLIADATFRAENAPFSFGDKEEMGFGVRVATPLAEKNGGRILDAEGRKQERKVWGNASAWCLNDGTIEGARVGILSMPDPANFRPSWFHARKYGLVLANPFGRKSYRKGGESRVEVKPGEPFRLRFGVLLFAGDIDADAEHAAFVETLRGLKRP